MSGRMDVPGPGTYEATENFRLQRSPKFSFSGSTREEAGQLFTGLRGQSLIPPSPEKSPPGPNAYDLAHDERSIGSCSKPTIKFGPDRKERKPVPDKLTSYDASDSPGPGDYLQEPDTFDGRSCSFGGSDRGSFYKQWVGVDPPTGCAAHVGYMGVDGLIAGDNLQRPSSPSAFISPIHSTEQRRPTTAPASETRGSSSGLGVPHSRPSNRPRPSERYDWIYASTGGPPARFKKGTGLSEDSRRPTSPAASFGTEMRFQEKTYMAHNPKVAAKVSPTPGPGNYNLPTDFQGPNSDASVGSRKKGFSFAKTCDRTPPQLKKKVRDQEPGPGAYNLVFDHRVEAIMMEAQVYDLGATMDLGDEDVDLMSTATGRTGHTAKTAISMADKSVSSVASSLGIKFGDMPTSPMAKAPSFTFGTGHRSSAQKVYMGKSLSKCKPAVNSPGSYTVSLRPSTPSYSFGGKNVKRDLIRKQNNNVGPAAFGRFTGKPNKQISFGKSASRDQAQKVFVPGAGYAPRDVPGPIYGTNNLTVSSRYRRTSSFGFGLSSRESWQKVRAPGVN